MCTAFASLLRRLGARGPGLAALLAASFIALAGTAPLAAEPPAAEPPAAEPPAAEPPAAKPAPYSLPWLLRPVTPGTVVRSDTSIALHDDGTSVASTLLAGHAIRPDLGLYLRGAATGHWPDGGDSAAALVNPVVLALYAPKLSHPQLKLSIAGAVVLPLGQGGGDAHSPARRASALSGVRSRSGMDNALFATNYGTLIGGAGVAWVADGLTVQAEVTVLELIRVRGAAVDPDRARTNFTSGLHVGYAVVPRLVASAELHYQRWLTTPALVEANPAARDQATALVGLRATVPLSGVVLRPGISYSLALDDPMRAASYHIIGIDIPVIF
jgi:hypothetical protein